MRANPMSSHRQVCLQPSVRVKDKPLIGLFLTAILIAAIVVSFAFMVSLKARVFSISQVQHNGQILLVFWM